MSDSQRSRRSVLLLPGVYGVVSQVWIHRQAILLRRYVSTIGATGYINRRQYPHPGVHLIDSPAFLRHRCYQVEYAVRQRQWPRSDCLAQWRLRRILRRVSPAIVHAHFLYNAAPALPALAEHECPLVVTVHGTDVNRGLLDKQYWDRVTPVLHHADCIIAVSAFMRRRLIELGCPPEKIVILPLGVPVPPSAADVGRQGGAIRIVTVGSLVPVKGHRYLLQAFALAAERSPRLELTIVGDGRCRQRLVSEAKELGIAQRVAFRGWLTPDEVNGVLMESHIYAQHSIRVAEPEANGAMVCREEALGISFLEASAAGLPVIGTRSGGISEAIRDGETGYLVKELDVTGMASRLVALAENGPLRSRIGAAGREFVQAEYGQDQQIAKLENLYDNVIQHRVHTGSCR